MLPLSAILLCCSVPFFLFQFGAEARQGVGMRLRHQEVWGRPCALTKRIRKEVPLVLLAVLS